MEFIFWILKERQFKHVKKLSKNSHTLTVPSNLLNVAVSKPR